MKNYPRLFVAIAVLLSGLALIPYVGLSSEPFGWQRYADVYEPAPAEVEIENFAFRPDVIFIPAGTEVRWTNRDDVSHTVTSDDGLFDSGTLLRGDRFEYRFDVPGTYTYFCAIHPSMRGTVVVLDRALDVFLPVVLK